MVNYKSLFYNGFRAVDDAIFDSFEVEMVGFYDEMVIILVIN